MLEQDVSQSVTQDAINPGNMFKSWKAVHSSLTTLPSDSASRRAATHTDTNTENQSKGFKGRLFGHVTIPDVESAQAPKRYFQEVRKCY